jgi:tetratricopeptide (TPR) repeat protein
MRFPHRSSANPLFIAALVALAPDGARAQAIGRGFDLERTGRLDSAAAYYLSAAHSDPTNLPALLGLERVLPQLSRMAELLPLVQRAVERDSASGALRGLLLRTYVALDASDSAAAVARHWAQDTPHDEAPYREWALALADRQANADARQVLLDARKTLDQPAAFALELAALAEQSGDWDAAAREWGSVVMSAPAQAQTAATQLAGAPAEQRERIVQRLTGREGSSATKRLAAELVLGWGDPPRAWTIFESTLGAPSAETADALRRFADLAAVPGTRAAWRVRGLALSRFAPLASEPRAARARADAARSFLQAEDAVAARAEVERVTANGAAPADVQRMAATTLISALIQDGKLDSAAVRLRRAGDRLSLEDRAALGIALARARIRHGQLALADSALANDSSLEAVAMHGWIALYRGDLREARARFRAAGPYAGGSREATERTAMVALLERILQSSFPALGDALLILARGDSAAAVTALRQVADPLTMERGRGDVLFLAGRICERLGPQGEATAAVLFDEVVRVGGSGAAPPAAELAWAELLLRQGQNARAVGHLEHLILAYPESAVVPEARRRLDEAKGAIPRS